MDKREYNIYAGLGEEQYYSTILAYNQDEATEYAYECARAEYEMFEEDEKVKSWTDVAYDLGYNPLEDDLSEDEEKEVSEEYNRVVENWIKYRAILTSEDNIKEEDLVREHDIC